jgi:hypothetical protein
VFYDTTKTPVFGNATNNATIPSISSCFAGTHYGAHTVSDYLTAVYSGVPGASRRVAFPEYTFTEVTNKADLLASEYVSYYGYVPNRAGAYHVHNLYRGDAIGGWTDFASRKGSNGRTDIGLITSAFAEIDEGSYADQMAKLDALEQYTGLHAAAVVMSGDDRYHSKQAAWASNPALKDLALEKGKSLHWTIALQAVPNTPEYAAKHREVIDLLIATVGADKQCKDIARLSRMGGVVGQGASSTRYRIQTVLRIHREYYEIDYVLEKLREYAAHLGIDNTPTKRVDTSNVLGKEWVASEADDAITRCEGFVGNINAEDGSKDATLYRICCIVGGDFGIPYDEAYKIVDEWCAAKGIYSRAKKRPNIESKLTRAIDNYNPEKRGWRLRHQTLDTLGSAEDYWPSEEEIAAFDSDAYNHMGMVDLAVSEWIAHQLDADALQIDMSREDMEAEDELYKSLADTYATMTKDIPNCRNTRCRAGTAVSTAKTYAWTLPCKNWSCPACGARKAVSMQLSARQCGEYSHMALMPARSTHSASNAAARRWAAGGDRKYLTWASAPDEHTYILLWNGAATDAPRDVDTVWADDIAGRIAHIMSEYDPTAWADYGKKVRPLGGSKDLTMSLHNIANMLIGTKESALTTYTKRIDKVIAAADKAEVALLAEAAMVTEEVDSVLKTLSDVTGMDVDDCRDEYIANSLDVDAVLMAEEEEWIWIDKKMSIEQIVDIITTHNPEVGEVTIEGNPGQKCRDVEYTCTPEVWLRAIRRCVAHNLFDAPPEISLPDGDEISFD